MRSVVVTYLTVMGLLSCTSCSTYKILNTPLVGVYDEKPYIVYTDKSFEEVWSKTIDFFAEKGVSITTIDKSSGLIVASRIRFFGEYITQESSGVPQKEGAFVVLNRCGLQQGYSYEDVKPTQVYGDWNVRIKSDGVKTSVNVNLLNFTVQSSPVVIGMVDMSGCVWDCKSTRVFERQLTNVVTK